MKRLTAIDMPGGTGALGRVFLPVRQEEAEKPVKSIYAASKYLKSVICRVATFPQSVEEAAHWRDSLEARLSHLIRACKLIKQSLA